MIRVQPSSSHRDRVLVGSDLCDPAAARHEVNVWLAANGYFVPECSRLLSVFEDGVLVREWTLAERYPQTAPRRPVTASMRRRVLAGTGAGAPKSYAASATAAIAA
jgi:hypothetical protein